MESWSRIQDADRYRFAHFSTGWPIQQTDPWQQRTEHPWENESEENGRNEARTYDGTFVRELRASTTNKKSIMQRLEEVCEESHVQVLCVFNPPLAATPFLLVSHRESLRREQSTDQATVCIVAVVFLTALVTSASGPLGALVIVYQLLIEVRCPEFPRADMQKKVVAACESCLSRIGFCHNFVARTHALAHTIMPSFRVQHNSAASGSVAIARTFICVWGGGGGEVDVR